MRISLVIDRTSSKDKPTKNKSTVVSKHPPPPIMSVQLEPAELGFKRPFTREVAETLSLHNPNRDHVAFKVKTTAPKQYCVRPNSGRISPGQTVEVQVLLQAMKEDPPLDTKCRDKFLVQSVAIDSSLDENVNVHDVWQHIEQTAKSSIQEKKIRVIYLSEGASVHDDIGESSFVSQRSPSPSQQAHTPRTPQYASDARREKLNSVAPPPYESGSSAAATRADEKSSAANGVLASVANAIPTSSAELQKKLDEATATISSLRDQIANQGLRQRKPQSGASDADAKGATGASGTATVQAPTSTGVPVQIVAALCLLCFLIAYFLF